MPGAGDLRDVLEFSQRALDSEGERTGEWGDSFRQAAMVQFLRGSEAVMEQRLQGNQPVVITVRDCQSARALTSAWRAVDVRRGTVYDLKGAAPAKERGFVDITAVANGANQS